MILIGYFILFAILPDVILCYITEALIMTLGELLVSYWSTWKNKANNYTHLADRTVRKFTFVLYAKGHCGP